MGKKLVRHAGSRIPSVSMHALKQCNSHYSDLSQTPVPLPCIPISKVSLLVPAPFQDQLLQESNPKPTESDSGRAGVSVITLPDVLRKAEWK